MGADAQKNRRFRLTDDALMDLIFRAQLKCVAGGVIDRYVGGHYAVCPDDDSAFAYSSGMSRIARATITDKLSPGHLLIRLKRLFAQGHLSSTWSDMASFHIDSDKARKAFSAARQWWLTRGVPTGYENGRARTTALSDFDRLVSECEAFLLGIFAGENSRETASVQQKSP